MKARRYSREGNVVLRDGKPYATAKDEIAAVTIVSSLLIAEGRLPPEPDAR